MSARAMRVTVLHGVNLDQLGRRDPAQYGTITLPELEARVRERAQELGMEATCFQTNHEGEFVERLHACRGSSEGVVLNPGAWTHYAWSIRDALEIAGVPALEIHLSDIEAREEWRRVSVIRELCFATVSGRGPEGYDDALELMRAKLEEDGG